MEILISLLAGFVGGLAARRMTRTSNEERSVHESRFEMPSLLEMEEGDRLILNYKKEMSKEQRENLALQLENTRSRVIVLTGDFQLSVLRGMRQRLEKNVEKKANNDKEYAY